MTNRASRRPQPEGWTITPKTIRWFLSLAAVVAVLWKPIQVGMELSTSIDRLSTAVTAVQDVIKTQQADVGILKTQVSGLQALKDARDRQLQSLEGRVQALEAKR